jgi:hypothetical protein
MNNNFDLKKFLAEGKLLKEDMSVIDKILDKISSQGEGSLTPEEKNYLDQYSKGEKNLIDPYSSDLVVTYYKNKDNYDEKGLADDFHEEEGKKVKYIVGYDENDDMDDIGYIYSKSGKDIETEYTEDDLDDAFMDSLK